MSLFLRTALQTGIPFGFFMGLFFGVPAFLLKTLFDGLTEGISTGFYVGIIAALGCGIPFGLATAYFADSRAKIFKANRPLLSDEVLLKEGGANHFLNGEAVGGWIYLTNTRFYYQSHNFNVQNHKFIVLLDEISKVEKANTFGIIPNQLRLFLKDGRVEKFVVNDIKDWVRMIEKVI